MVLCSGGDRRNMFSITAINDTDSKGKWEPLAPTKEAQEFHLSQTYHEGLLKLQGKEYVKAQELLESVLKDPLMTSAQANGNAKDSHLSQLRFLALKNLATVFLQQDPAHHENVLHCYLQAVEIDTRDSVVWNQLGTLSYSMGLLSISRWAFEQGLLCSPNNWNCMEKLLEVLVAVGDEVACLSIAELILRHWPSHSRALHVKNTIEEPDPTPFTPKGIDKLEPKHIRLNFGHKRKATDDNLDKDVLTKKLKQIIELRLSEISWTSLATALLGVLVPKKECGSESGDIRINVQLPQSPEAAMGSLSEKEQMTLTGESICTNYLSPIKCNVFREKESNTDEEHHHERRSTRLRSRKPDKEDLDMASSKDPAKVIVQCLKHFILGGAGVKVSDNNVSYLASHADAVDNPVDLETCDVTRFVMETLNNFGAYHMGHMLLEEVANKTLSHRDTFSIFLELEKWTRHWGQDRSPDCCLFLAELYYDLALHFPDKSKLAEFISEASYHLCKIIEPVALNYPFNTQGSGSDTVIESKCNDELTKTCSQFMNNFSFWARFFWLSGQLSLLEGDRKKAQQELSVCLSFFTNKADKKEHVAPICLPHCKIVKKLTIDRVLQEINLLEVDLQLKNIRGMIENEMYPDCVNLLAPLLFSAQDIHLDTLRLDGNEGGVPSAELSALDILIEACHKATPMDAEVLLNSHRRKLQILIVAAGMSEFYVSNIPGNFMSMLKLCSSPVQESNESTVNRCKGLIAEEVKAVSQCASKLKNLADPSANSAGDFIMPLQIVADIQSLLMAIMCNIAVVGFSKKSSGPAVTDETEQSEKSCFMDAAIAFCRLQHLIPTMSIKAQTDLIVALHDLLAEHGICCAAGDGEEEGMFLKLAIKHLLSLDMKLKGSALPSSKGSAEMQCDKRGHEDNFKSSSNERNLEKANDNCLLRIDMGSIAEQNILEQAHLKDGLSQNDVETERTSEVSKSDCKGLVNIHNGEESNKLHETDWDISEEEREELELGIDNALDQCFFCLYGLNLRSDASYEDDLSQHKNTSRGDYHTKEQCADVFQYILPYAKASTRTGLVKLRRVLRAIRKHFPQPPDNVLAGNAIDNFLDGPNLCEDKLFEESGSNGFTDSIMKIIYPSGHTSLQERALSSGSCSSDIYLEVYSNLYYLLALSEEMSATDKWAGFVLTKEGEEFVEHNTNLFKYDLSYNPLRFESWQRLANIYDEEVDLLLNDGSKQINVTVWRKNSSLSQRVETSRRRSRRCLLMTLALAKTPAQQGEIHELLALVYYDGLQNVVPLYDQRYLAPSKDAVWKIFCHNSMRHFKKASAHKEDWSYAFYLGKLSEKLGFSHETSLFYYDMAIKLNPTAVDAVYRMHASRLKLLFTCEKQNTEGLKVVGAYSFCQTIKEKVMNYSVPELPEHVDSESNVINSDDRKLLSSNLPEDMWHLLYRDCISALETCVEGDLKHFHKARYMLAQGLYRRGEKGDLERAKEELSFCFKSSRSSFTINLWEIDSTVKKGRRKTLGPSGSKKVLEVHLPESSRKFITCMRKYIMFYWKLLEETGDICTLDRAYVSLRTDKRFSLCLEDLVPLALGRYVKALISSIRQIKNDGLGSVDNSELLLEKMFTLFVEQINLWADICNLQEIRDSELSESNLYGYLQQFIQLLEINVKVEKLEEVNEKIRKRFKNPKLSNNLCAKIYRHVSIAWYHSLIINLALITPLGSEPSSDTGVISLSDHGAEKVQVPYMDLQLNELWYSPLEDTEHLMSLETKWNPLLSKIKNVKIRKVKEEDLETATTLLRCSYNFYKDSYCLTFPSGLNFYMISSQLAMVGNLKPGTEGCIALDMSIPRKLLLWAYMLLHGRYANISAILKYCEENVKSKAKKGMGVPSTSPSPATTPSTTLLHTGGGKDGESKCIESEIAATLCPTLLERDSSQNMLSVISLPASDSQLSSPNNHEA